MSDVCIYTSGNFLSAGMGLILWVWVFSRERHLPRAWVGGWTRWSLSSWLDPPKPCCPTSDVALSLENRRCYSLVICWRSWQPCYCPWPTLQRWVEPPSHSLDFGFTWVKAYNLFQMKIAWTIPPLKFLTTSAYGQWIALKQSSEQDPIALKYVSLMGYNSHNIKLTPLNWRLTTAHPFLWFIHKAMHCAIITSTQFQTIFSIYHKKPFISVSLPWDPWQSLMYFLSVWYGELILNL